jgi:hypothetical protein
MLELLFSSKYTEKILFFLLLNEKGHASLLARRFNAPLNGIQNTLKKLERAGVVASFLEGKTKVYQFDPRYPFLAELRLLLNKAYGFVPAKQRELYAYPERKRPRRSGKPLS